MLNGIAADERRHFPQGLREDNQRRSLPVKGSETDCPM